MNLKLKNKYFFIQLGVLYVFLGPIFIGILVAAQPDLKSMAAIPGLLLAIGTIIGGCIFKNRNNKKEEWYFEKVLIDAKKFTRIEYTNRILFVDGNWAWSFPNSHKNRIYTKFEITKFYNRKKEYLSYSLSPYSTKHEFTVIK
jgi:hypothetical protein